MNYNRKIFNISLEVLELAGVRDSKPEDIIQYLKEMLELPQHPEAEVGHPFYVISVDWDSMVKFSDAPIEIGEDTDIDGKITLGKGNFEIHATPWTHSDGQSVIVVQKTKIEPVFEIKPV